MDSLIILEMENLDLLMDSTTVSCCTEISHLNILTQLLLPDPD